MADAQAFVLFGTPGLEWSELLQHRLRKQGIDVVNCTTSPGRMPNASDIWRVIRISGGPSATAASAAARKPTLARELRRARLRPPARAAGARATR